MRENGSLDLQQVCSPVYPCRYHLYTVSSTTSWQSCSAETCVGPRRERAVPRAGTRPRPVVSPASHPPSCTKDTLLQYRNSPPRHQHASLLQLRIYGWQKIRQDFSWKEYMFSRVNSVLPTHLSVVQNMWEGKRHGEEVWFRNIRVQTTFSCIHTDLFAESFTDIKLKQIKQQTQTSFTHREYTQPLFSHWKFTSACLYH